MSDERYDVRFHKTDDGTLYVHPDDVVAFVERLAAATDKGLVGRAQAITIYGVADAFRRLFSKAQAVESDTSH